MSLSNAARPGFSCAVLPHSKAVPAWRLSRLARTCLAIAAAAAVDRQRPLVDGGGQLRVADLEPREDWTAGLAEAQHVIARRQGFERLVGPFGKNGSVGGTDAQRLRRE